MSAVLERNPDILWRDEPEQRTAIVAALEQGEAAGERGWVILVCDGEMHELNLVAGDIWCLADGTRNAEAVAAILAERYDAPLAEILEDVEVFVNACQKRGWLQVR